LIPQGATYAYIQTAPMAHGWFMDTTRGTLWGNGKQHSDSDKAGGYEQGDRAGVLLDLGDGSLRFFRNQEWRAARPRLRSRQRDRPSMHSSNITNDQPQRERAATAKRTAARANDFQGRRRYLRSQYSEQRCKEPKRRHSLLGYTRPRDTRHPSSCVLGRGWV
jgi:hypothetical protein